MKPMFSSFTLIRKMLLLLVENRKGRFVGQRINQFSNARVRGVRCQWTSDALIIILWGDNPLRPVQECETAKVAWDKLQITYARKTVVNMISALKSLLYTEFQRCTGIRNHIFLLEPQFSRLANRCSTIEKEVKIAILVTSLSQSN